MNATKRRFFLVALSVLCGTSLVFGGPVNQVSHQTADRQQGSAVLFYVAHQGQLRDVMFNPVILNQVLVNEGSAYDNNTGVFTAPIAGIYQFVFVAQLCRGPHNNNWDFMVNGDERMKCHAQVSGGDTTLNTCYYMEKLKKGDQVWIKQRAGSCAWASTTSKTITFSGILLASQGASTLGGRYGSSCPLPSLSHRVAPSSAGRRAAGSGVFFIMLLCLFLWE
ncbi:multimerin-2-like [Melanotaenia boesemani]|uniref:multimerin-2-like n=1 Tax=Melanotaenia boesemani TaxID=1250792 RepID=UPI001C0414C2|nr:multimerin-2-like [Melanotaenia boesemani]